MQKVVKSGQITVPDRLFKNLAELIFDKYTEIGIDLGLINRLYAIVPNSCHAHARTLTAVDPNSGQLQLARTKRS